MPGGKRFGAELLQPRAPDDFPYVSDVAVAPPARGKGIGRALLNACESAMVRQGLEKIYLHVKVDNEEGQALFERSGYEEPADAKAGLTQFQVRSIQKFFTHRSVSTFDRSPFQLTGELFFVWNGPHSRCSPRWRRRPSRAGRSWC